MGMELWWNDIDRGKLKYWEKTCPCAAWATTNPTWTGLGSNLGCKSERDEYITYWCIWEKFYVGGV